MPFYSKGLKIFNSKLLKNNNKINKQIIPHHINTSTTNKLVGKNPSTDRSVYSYQNPYGSFIRNPNCWLNGISNISCFSPAQLSGAAWNQRGGTLITRKHALFAKHFVTSILPNGGTPLIFVDDNNNSISRNIIQYSYDVTDIAIALLNSEVPNNIKVAKVLPPNYQDYIETSSYKYAIGLDQEEKAIVKRANLSYGGYVVSDGQGGTVNVPNIYVFNLENNNPYFAFTEDIVVGDSGNPAFIIIDNELVVLTAWWFNTGGLRPIYTGGPFITTRYNQVNNIIESLSPGEGYSLTPVDLASVYAKYS